MTAREKCIDYFPHFCVNKIKNIDTAVRSLTAPHKPATTYNLCLDSLKNDGEKSTMAALSDKMHFFWRGGRINDHVSSQIKMYRSTSEWKWPLPICRPRKEHITLAQQSKRSRKIIEKKNLHYRLPLLFKPHENVVQVFAVEVRENLISGVPFL